MLKLHVSYTQILKCIILLDEKAFQAEIAYSLDSHISFVNHSVFVKVCFAKA